MQAIEAHQQPAAQLLIDRMVPVAYGGLRHLCNKRLGVTQQQEHHRTAAIEFPFQ
jgi:hypothetical protein